MHSLLHFQHHLPEWSVLLTTDESVLINHNHLVVYHVIVHSLWFTLHVVHSMDLDVCITTRSHHYGIIQNIFTALKALVFHLFILPQQPLIFLLSA